MGSGILCIYHNPDKPEIIYLAPLSITSQALKPVEPEEVFKDVYNFEFLELKKNYKEEELKSALLDKVEERDRQSKLVQSDLSYRTGTLKKLMPSVRIY
jgi:hypothetical protein